MKKITNSSPSLDFADFRPSFMLSSAVFRQVDQERLLVDAAEGGRAGWGSTRPGIGPIGMMALDLPANDFDRDRSGADDDLER